MTRSKLSDTRRTPTADKWPVGAFMDKGLTLKTGQTHVQRYLRELLQLTLGRKIDTTGLVSHRLPLERAPEGYENFKKTGTSGPRWSSNRMARV